MLWRGLSLDNIEEENDICTRMCEKECKLCSNLEKLFTEHHRRVEDNIDL